MHWLYPFFIEIFTRKGTLYQLFALNFILTVNGIWWGGLFTPPCCKIFSLKYWQILYIWFFDLFNIILLANFWEKKFRAFAALGSCHVTSSWQVSLWFLRFLEYISEFSIFFHEIDMVARSSPVLAEDIKSLT